ncbi:unnamed protein product [Urochloa decumbens]|uniref:Uncharacterized protein n=1 Tax=Urochloa decumbens TaxID=240449 RepID=A0ABC9CAI5_9POAL
MAMVASTSFTYHKPRLAVVCRKNKDGRDKEKEKEHKHPFKVVEITPPPRCLGVRCFPTVRASLLSVHSSTFPSSDAYMPQLSCRVGFHLNFQFCTPLAQRQVAQHPLRRERDDRGAGVHGVGGDASIPAAQGAVRA